MLGDTKYGTTTWHEVRILPISCTSWRQNHRKLLFKASRSTRFTLSMYFVHVNTHESTQMNVESHMQKYMNHTCWPQEAQQVCRTKYTFHPFHILRERKFTCITFFCSTKYTFHPFHVLRARKWTWIIHFCCTKYVLWQEYVLRANKNLRFFGTKYCKNHYLRARF